MVWIPKWGWICRHFLPPRTEKGWQEKNREGAKKGTVYRRKRWINKCTIMNSNARAMYLFREDQWDTETAGLLARAGVLLLGHQRDCRGQHLLTSSVSSFTWSCLWPPGDQADHPLFQFCPIAPSVCEKWYILLGCDPTSSLSNGSAPTLSCMLVPCSFLRRGPSRVNNLKAQFVYQSCKSGWVQLSGQR